MNFNQISFKIFKANLRRYLLFFFCSSFTIMIFFTYSTILTNKEFMDPSKISSSISSNLIAPSLGIVLLFIIYAHASFAKFRRTEFGLFMVLGMTNLDIGRIMLFENSLIWFFSLLTGLVSGTLFSRLFYFLISKIVDIEGITFSASFESYLYTIIFFTVIYILVILINFIVISRYEIISLLKASRKADKNLISKPYLAFIGILMIGLSFFDMIIHYTTGNSAVFIRSFSLCFLGIYLLISNMIWFITKLLSKKKYVQNILFISNLKYTFGQSKNILFIISVLVSMTIFFCSIAGSLLSDSQNFATQYNPYHIAYTEVFDKNKLTDIQLNNIINNGETQLDSYKSMEFIYEASAKRMVLSDEILNSTLGSRIQVEKDHFINLFQVVMNDGYQHDLYEMKQLEIKTTTGSYKYVSQGQMTEVLFNRTPLLAMSYVILNNSDYLKVKAEIDPIKISSIKLINFKDWYKTKGILDKLSHELEMYNEENTRISPSDVVFKPVSRINDYLEHKQGGSFILFLFSFIGVLFFLSSAVILHFKLLIEFEREKIKYKKLYKIGITEMEISRVISKEIKVLFILPVLIGTMVAIFYSYSMPIVMGKEMLAMKYSLIFSLIYLLIQFVFYLLYKRFYIKKFYQIFK
jgi:hypothetical protein